MKKRKWMVLLMTGMLSVSMAAPQAALASDAQILAGEQKEVLNENKDGQDGEKSGQDEKEKAEEYVFDSYLKTDLLAENKAGKLIMSEELSEVKCSDTKYGKGLLLTGTVGALNAGRITINEEYDFNRNPVGRISVDGLADRGMTVDVLVYLDDDKQPAATFRLGSQMGKKEWANAGDHTLDVHKEGISGKHRVSIGFEVSGKGANKKTDILMRSVEFSENSIPVMYFHIDESKGSISAMNGSENHSVECYGTVDIQIPDGYVSEYTGKAVDTDKLQGLALEYIRGRGNSTWGTDKKPYKVKLDKKTDLFGMGANKHWVLLANRYDNSLVRNRMTYWLGKELGMEYTPECVPVEVVMNGTYYGSYLLCEQIRIGDSRVEIDDLEDNDASMNATDEPLITGGYLLSMGPYGDEDPDNMFETSHGASFLIESPSFEKVANETQRNYIKAYLQATENAIYGKGFCDENGKPYSDYLDLDAAAKYWWIQEFSANGDAYGSGSTYLYKKRFDENHATEKNGKDGKLYWGPLWDFDYVAWGDLQYDLNVPQTFEYTSTPWFDRMRRDPAFNRLLAEKWTVLSQKLDEVIREGGLLDQYYAQMKTSWTYDHEKWGTYGEAWDEEADKPKALNYTYSQEIEQLRNWIRLRKEWVEENIGELTPEVFTVTLKLDGKVVDTQKVQSGSGLDELLQPPEKKGKYFYGWCDAYGSVYYEGDPVYSNLELTARYEDASAAKKAKALYLDNYDVYRYYDPHDDAFYSPMWAIMPYDAGNTPISWSVSDPEIASVDGFGNVTFLGYGDVKVTGTLPSGASASYQLHLLNYNEEIIPSETLEFDRYSLQLKEGGYTQIVASGGPAPYYSSYIVWFSSDPDVASVDDLGVVTAGKAGKAVIVAMDMDTRISQKCEVTVTAKSGQQDPKKSDKGKTTPAKKQNAAKQNKKTAVAKRIAAAKAKKVKLRGKVLKNGRVRLTWKKRKGVTGYQIYRFSEKKGVYKKVATIKKAGKRKWTSPKKLKNGMKVWYRVRPYTRIGKKVYVGKWSNVKTLKRKKSVRISLPNGGVLMKTES